MRKLSDWYNVVSGFLQRSVLGPLLLLLLFMLMIFLIKLTVLLKYLLMLWNITYTHLSPVDETRVLGIRMDSTMKFSMQCSKATNKTMQPLGQIKRTFLINYSTVFSKFIQT